VDLTDDVIDNFDAPPIDNDHDWSGSFSLQDLGDVGSPDAADDDLEDETMW
jgi:hypothetical protein